MNVTMGNLFFVVGSEFRVVKDLINFIYGQKPMNKNQKNMYQN